MLHHFSGLCGVIGQGKTKSHKERSPADRMETVAIECAVEDGFHAEVKGQW